MTDVKWWDATFPIHKTDFERLTETADNLCERYVIGKECGAGGYEHYQARFVFKVPKELATVCNQFKDACNCAHWSKTSRAGRNFDYVEKEGQYFCSWERALRKYAMLTLRDWQAQLEQLFQNEDERTVIVVYDERGNHGKTYFAKYMQATHQAQYVPQMDSAMDIMAFALEKKHHGYIVDLPRAESVKVKRGMWSAIEQLKNGYIYDKRYKYRDEWRDPARIVVFCNELPEYDNLSADRWKLLTIADTPLGDMLLPYTWAEASE